MRKFADGLSSLGRTDIIREKRLAVGVVFRETRALSYLESS